MFVQTLGFGGDPGQGLGPTSSYNYDPNNNTAVAVANSPISSLPVVQNSPPTEAAIYAPAANYTGNSITDFLSAANQPADFASRTALANKYGIGNYSGTAAQNTQLLGLLKAHATGDVSPTGIPNNIGNILDSPTVPAINSPISISSLSPTNNNDINNVLNSSVKDNTISSDIGGLLGLYNTTTDSEKQYNDLNDQLTTAMKSLGNEGTDLQNELDKNGVSASYDQVKQLNLNAAKLKGQLDSFDAETQNGNSQIQDQGETTGTPGIFISGDQARYNKQRDLTRLSMAAELSSTLALSQAYQGNADIGQKLAENAVDLKYKPILNEIDVLKSQLSAAGNSMTREDQKRGNIISSLLNIKQNEINQKVATTKQIQTMAIQAASAGAPLSVIQAMQQVTDPVMAAQIGNKYLHATGEASSGGTTSNNYVTNKETDESVKKIIAQNPGEYGNAANSIDKQFGAGTASKYDIWLRAVYNEGQSPSSLNVTSTLKGAGNNQFTQNQTDNGAQNAGLSIGDFNNLDTDVKNFFINGSSQVIQAFNESLQTVASGDDPQPIIDEINQSNLPQGVKGYMLEKIQAASTQTNKQPGFFNKIWDTIKNIGSNYIYPGR